MTGQPMPNPLKHWSRWERLRKKGRAHFLLVYGVGYWAVAAGVLWSIGMCFVPESCARAGDENSVANSRQRPANGRVFNISYSVRFRFAEVDFGIFGFYTI